MFQLQYSGGRFQDLFYSLEEWGFGEIILPFILIFTVIFAVLSKIQLFTENKYNSIIALAIALMAVIPHALGKYPPGLDIITIINTALPEATLLIIAIVILLILTGLLWGTAPGKGLFTGFVAIIAIIILVAIFLSTITPIPIISSLDSRLITLIVGILVFGIIFLYVGSGGSKGEGWAGAIKAAKELFR
jgi:hypothetical protein